MMYHGDRVQSDSAILMSLGQPHSDTWESFDLKIDYTYQQQANILELSGKVALAERYQTSYDSLNDLQVYLFFFDSDFQVVKTLSISKVFASSVDVVMEFNQSYKIPSGAIGYTFGYYGSAYEVHTLAPFSQLPLSK